MTLPRITVGDPVEGRDGHLGTLVGIREAASSHWAGYLLVRLVHTTRLVPLAWVRPAHPGSDRVILNASRAQVAGCPPVRTGADLRADVVQALARDPVLRKSCLQVASWHGEVELSGDLPSEDARQRASQLALTVGGVTRVRNDATILPVLPDSTWQEIETELNKLRRQTENEEAGARGLRAANRPFASAT